VPRTVDYTIAYHDGTATYDLCKVLFGGDGSYYVTAPYHPQDRAIAAKVVVNYTDSDGLMNLAEAKELAVVDDDKRRLKLSHHPDGFLQLSGEGITSGRDETGGPKGMGTFSWGLLQPTLGPSWQLIFSDPALCGRPTAGRPRTVALPEAELEHMRRAPMSGLSIIGYYFPPSWREFVYFDANGVPWIDLLHPNAQAVKKLRVLLASKESDVPGLIGLEARPHGLEIATGDPAFFLTSSTGNLRRNAAGELIGDQLLCVFPMPDFGQATLPTLNYRLSAPPYRAPWQRRVLWTLDARPRGRALLRLAHRLGIPISKRGPQPR
jgi:hypothetical protein